MWLSRFRAWMAERQVRAIRARVDYVADELDYWHDALTHAQVRARAASNEAALAQAYRRVQTHGRSPHI